MVNQCVTCGCFKFPYLPPPTHVCNTARSTLLTAFILLILNFTLTPQLNNKFMTNISPFGLLQAGKKQRKHKENKCKISKKTLTTQACINCSMHAYSSTCTCMYMYVSLLYMCRWCLGALVGGTSVGGRWHACTCKIG